MRVDLLEEDEERSKRIKPVEPPPVEPDQRLPQVYRHHPRNHYYGQGLVSAQCHSNSPMGHFTCQGPKWCTCECHQKSLFDTMIM